MFPCSQPGKMNDTLFQSICELKNYTNSKQMKNSNFGTTVTFGIEERRQFRKTNLGETKGASYAKFL